MGRQCRRRLSSRPAELLEARNSGAGSGRIGSAQLVALRWRRRPHATCEGVWDVRLTGTELMRPKAGALTGRNRPPR